LTELFDREDQGLRILRSFVNIYNCRGVTLCRTWTFDFTAVGIQCPVSNQDSLLTNSMWTGRHLRKPHQSVTT